MAWTVESALDNELVHNPRKLLAEYQFTLGNIAILITIRLYQPIGVDRVEFEQSHFIHTPVQIGPYRTSCPWNDDEASALRQAVEGFTRFYKDAVREGHAPNEAWLVRNEQFWTC